MRIEDLPKSNFSHELIGDDHGGVGVSIIFVEAPPGSGPSLHKHPYVEIFVVQQGEALFVAGSEERTVRAGEVVIAPAETPHRFVNTGDETLRQVDIHLSPRFVTEWLE
jgi:mannose-6-phosphate isomerase-like protein (cupin superfamily)